MDKALYPVLGKQLFDAYENNAPILTFSRTYPDMTIEDAYGNIVATISKDIFHWTDTYIIDVENEENALAALMVVISIDAEKCSRN